LTQPDGSNLGDIVGANDVDKRPLWTLAHRFFANCDRIEQGNAKDAQADELAWKQETVRVGEDRACLDRAGLRIDSRSGRIELASMRVEAAIAEIQLHRQVFVIDRFCAPFIEVAVGLSLLIGERKIHIGRILRRDRRQERLLGLDQRADRRRVQSCEACDRRPDVRVSEVQFGVGDFGLRSLDRGAGLIAGRERVFTLLFRCDVTTREFLHADIVVFRLAERRLCLIELGLGSGERHLVRRGVDLEKKLPLRDLVAFFEVSLEQQAADQRTHFHVPDPHNSAGILNRQRHLRCLRGYDANFRRRSCGALVCGEVPGDPRPAESSDIGACCNRDQNSDNGNVSLSHQPPS